MSSKNVVFPNELLENRKIETAIFPEHHDDFGVAVLSEVDEDSSIILSIYQMVWSNDEEAFSPVQELEAFRFWNREDLEEFLTRLPNITGLEMLMLLNPLPNNVH